MKAGSDDVMNRERVNADRPKSERQDPGKQDSDAPELDELLHDLRNPLNAISMSAELARLQIHAGKDQAAILLSLDSIIRECRKCSLMLDRLCH